MGSFFVFSNKQQSRVEGTNDEKKKPRAKKGPEDEKKNILMSAPPPPLFYIIPIFPWKTIFFLFFFHTIHGRLRSWEKKKRKVDANLLYASTFHFFLAFVFFFAFFVFNLSLRFFLSTFTPPKLL